MQTRLIEMSETLLTGFPAGLGVLRASIHDLRGSMSYIITVCLSIIQKNCLFDFLRGSYHFFSGRLPL